ncbi:DNA cytosine methyltransferase [Roseibium sp. FZY0029]|uniref:DNA cytosine methyltransferase n=1 Tax=Roseibium sp. FZY0029 TaxID=3116647 RepID=UPI002EBFD10A|nr:DNA cytosine methyltransferase [Roseibium sp. FZY0029]
MLKSPRIEAEESSAFDFDHLVEQPYSTSPENAAKSPLCVDLFAGAGGFSLGAIGAGFEVRSAVEYYCHAASTYRKKIRNLSGREIAVFERDILELNPHDLMDEAGLIEGDCDLLLGGPPCQGFSTHRLKKTGVDDPRNALLLRYFEFVRAIQPRMFLLENVPGMLQPKHAGYLKKFLETARSSGYAVIDPIMINARDFGVPQNRKRVFIVGYDPSRVTFDATWPPLPIYGDPSRSTPNNPLLPWISAAVAFEMPARENDKNDVHMSHGAALIETFKSTPPNGGSRSQSNRVLPCHEKHNGHKDVYGRIDPARPSPTMTTACINPSKGRFVHPTEHHGITARQAARLQTFPDDFEFEGGLMAAGIQIGNAVPVQLARFLCEYLREVLERSRANSSDLKSNTVQK